MDGSEYDCIICLDVCERAVESSCCYTLFCEKCSSGLKECPSCRKSNLRVAPSGFARKVIGRMKIPCSLCGASVQRDSVMEHTQVCEMRVCKCAARECDYEGLKGDLLQHVVSAHEADLLTITQRLGKSHAFQAVTADQCVQTTSAQCTDNATQTVCKCVCTCQQPEHKPVRQSNGKHYCGRLLPTACPCSTVRGQLSTYGCQQGKCGPEDGHNCPDCTRSDLRKNGLPLTGHVVCAETFPGYGRKIDLRAKPGTCVLEGNRGCRGHCRIDRLFKLLSTDKNSLYYEFLWLANLYDLLTDSAAKKCKEMWFSVCFKDSHKKMATLLQHL